VRLIARRLERRTGIGQRGVVEERAQQLVVAAAGLVRAREDGIDDLQPARRAKALIGDPLTRADAALACGMLERTHDGRADGDDPSVRRSSVADGRRRGFGNAIRLVERKASVELGVAG
jgi:hypothetical protein